MKLLDYLGCCGLLAAVLLTGCQNREAAAAAQAAALAARNEQAASQAEQEFNTAVGSENWMLAKAQADVLLANWPDTEAAVRVRDQFDDITARAETEREQRRLAALWHYHVQAVAGGQQRSAMIDSKTPVDVDGRGAFPVQLVFRDHPAWGRSSYLVLERGDFAQRCYRRCSIALMVDEATVHTMPAHRPDTDEAIAMFITDEKALWRRIRGARTIAIIFEVRDGTRRTVEFEVAGLDRSRLPGWD